MIGKMQRMTLTDTFSTLIVPVLRGIPERKADR